MKRGALALCAGLLLAGLIPGSTLAYAAPTQPNVDQQNGATSFDFDSLTLGAYLGFAQTFTVGKTGMLSGVSLYVGQQVTSSVTVRIDTIGGTGMPVGNDFAHGTASVGSPGFYHFSFSTPLAVTTGDQYVLVCGACANVAFAGTTADLYSGGYAMIDNNQPPTKVGWMWGAAGFPDAADLTFITFVDTVKAELSWDKPSITAGASTPLTLTAKMTYSNGEEAASYDSTLVSWPTWFTPQSITCTGQEAGSSPFTINPPECSLAHLESSLSHYADTGGIEATLTFVVTGTANPAAAAAGSSGSAEGESCLVYGVVAPGEATEVQPNQPDPACGSGTASVSVVASGTASTPPPTGAPTPPPTSSVTSSPAGSGGIVWFLPVGMVALLGCLFAASRRRVRAH